MSWLNTKDIYTDEYITIIPVIRGANPHIRAANARVFVREDRPSLQVLFCDEGDDEYDYVWHTSSYVFTEEEIRDILSEVHHA